MTLTLALLRHGELRVSVLSTYLVFDVCSVLCIVELIYIVLGVGPPIRSDAHVVAWVTSILCTIQGISCDMDAKRRCSAHDPQAVLAFRFLSYVCSACYLTSFLRRLIVSKPLSRGSCAFSSDTSSYSRHHTYDYDMPLMGFDEVRFSRDVLSRRRRVRYICQGLPVRRVWGYRRRKERECRQCGEYVWIVSNENVGSSANGRSQCTAMSVDFSGQFPVFVSDWSRRKKQTLIDVEVSNMNDGGGL